MIEFCTVGAALTPDFRYLGQISVALSRIGHFRLELGQPKHGWLPFRLELGHFVVEDAASNVLNDPVEALLDALDYLHNPGAPAPRVCLWLEPAGYALDIPRIQDTDNRFVVRALFDRDFLPPMRRHRMELRFECDVDGWVLSKGLHTGLRSLISGPGGPALDSWRRDKSQEAYRERLDSILDSSSGATGRTSR